MTKCLKYIIGYELAGQGTATHRGSGDKAQDILASPSSVVPCPCTCLLLC